MTGPIDPEARDGFEAGMAQYRAGAMADAAATFERALARQPDLAEAQRMRGLALVRGGRTAEGLKALSRAVAMAPGQSLPHLHHGVGLLLAGRHARAAARFRRAALLDPADPAPWINLSSALSALGEPAAARAAARRALRLAPGQPDALHALARGHAEMNELDKAVETYVLLLRGSPRRLAAWIDLGLVHARRGAMNEAAEAMRTALAIDPTCVAAAANLAGFSVVIGDQAGAIARLRALLEKDPSCAPARLNLANAMLLDRQAQPALEALEGPAPDGRAGVHWRAHKALALIMLSRMAEARALLDSIPQPYGDAEILIVNRRLQLARHARDEAAVADLANRLESLCGEERFLFEHRIIACFDLARMRHERGEKPQAFALWRRGHAMLARLQPFSRDEHRAFVDASIRRFDADRLRNGPRATNRDPAPVFIVGLPRTGTSLAEQILASHAQVHGAGERSALHELIVERSGGAMTRASVERLADFDRPALDVLADSYLRDLHAEAPDKRLIVDKMPANAMHLGMIATLFPAAKIILCRRDPRDIGLSIFQLRFFGHHPYAHDLADLGFYIGEHERLMAHWREALPLPMLEIALTDWSDDFSGTLARALHFLDLPPDPACERFYENPRLVRTASAAQVRQKVNRRGIGRWRAFADELAPFLAALREHPDGAAALAAAGEE